MERIKISPLDMCGDNLSESWRRWSQTMKLILTGPLSKRSNKEKCAFFLLYIGQEARDVFNTWTLAPNDEDKPDILFDKFEDYFKPKKNLTVLRHKFNSRVQGASESADQFITDLKLLSLDCEYGGLRDEMIRDRIVVGVYSEEVKEKLLQEANLTLDKSVEIIKVVEGSKRHIKSMANGTESSIDAVRKSAHKGVKQKVTKQASNSKQCGRCGEKHEKGQCPAYGKKCLKCNKRNHYAKMCRGHKAVHSVEQPQYESDNSETGVAHFIGAVHNCEERNEASVTLLLGNKKSALKFKLDTGAQVNIIPAKLFKNMNLPEAKVHSTNTKLTGYGGLNLKVKGTCDIKCSYKDAENVSKFYIVETDSPAVLGLQSCIDLGLIQLVMSVSESTGISDTLEKYNNVFTGLGCLKDPYHIQIDESVSPVVHPPRRVPAALRDRLKSTLCDMEQMGVIRKVDEPTDWVSSVVIVEKPNSNKLRICLDPKDLNNAIKREHLELPTLEEITSRMAGAKVFSKIDLNHGYWQQTLDQESQLLTTFNTPFGRYCYKRLPFGIKCAQEVFQKRISQHFDSMPGVETDIDDILIWGATEDEHDSRLEKVLKKCAELNLTLNKDKCKFKVETVTYLGNIISADGVKPDSEKVRAIMDMPPPTDRKGVERLLGTVNYLAKFVPKMSTVMEPIRILLRKDTEFAWLKPQQVAFTKVKDILSHSPVLQFFDVKKPVRISCDASKSGLGAVLLQDNKPVAFTSRSMTDAETRYAQIEKELLAVVFGMERFHQFIYGQDVVVENDHHPLEQIMKKKLSAAPPRLQRMLLRLQQYNFKLEYKPGKELIVADMLSRACTPDAESCTANDVVKHVQTVVSNIPVAANRIEDIKNATSVCTDFCQLRDIILNGWPDSKVKVPYALHEYWNCRDELTETDGLILRGDRIVIPIALRPTMLKLLHVGHMGVDKTIKRARDAIYWPSIDAQIKDMILKCATCLENRNPNQQREPLISHEIPDRPWQNLATDLFQLNDRNYVLVVDYYSRYFEVAHLNTTKATSVINQMKVMFARHGIPSKVTSDQGPQYSCAEFQEFAKSWGFQHIMSSPYCAKSNGLAERTVQTVKNILKKSAVDNTDPLLGFLEYRNTPIDGIAPPAELLMGHKLRSILPALHQSLKPKLQNPKQVKAALCKKQTRQKHYYDRHTKILKSLKEGEKVRILQQNKWEQATVKEKLNTPRSYLVTTPNGSVYQRNRSHILKSNEGQGIEDCRDESNTKTASVKQPPMGKNNWASNKQFTTRYGRTVKPVVKY